ncbi:hypothetical protein [uncultured Rubinisphaera sp.]|uniref:hypothetical protein n=1 Tax=uncultured Rubinisphaera sp. TaxID=1678686 RepID=UPI0030D9503D
MSKTLREMLIVCLAFQMAVGPIWACLWDYDTLTMERLEFPDTLELITGKFLRHSSEFYEWRIQDRKQKLEQDPSVLAYYDDLAVAYDKTGQHQLAIETMQAKNSIEPNLYETEANLGTFYIHSGQLEQGIEHINKAIAINPEAHFGREIYQQDLVNYVRLRQKNGKTVLPLRSQFSEEDIFDWPVYNFNDYILKVHAVPDSDGNPAVKDQDEELRKALKGILGMMRFGHNDSPILLEALGDLLSARSLHLGHSYGYLGGKQLAARAYLKASYEVDDEIAKQAYRNLAEKSLQLQLESTLGGFARQELSLNTLEESFQQELAEAKAWHDELHQDELQWIESGVDVDAAFTGKYYEEVTPLGNYANEIPPPREQGFIDMVTKSFVIFLIVSGGAAIYYAFRNISLSDDLPIKSQKKSNTPE